MKLLIVTCLREFRQAAVSIIHEAQIKVFSISNTIGRKEGYKEDLLDDWFAAGNENFDSIVLFSFTEEDKAIASLHLFTKYNESTAPEFPIRAFIIPVEQSNY